MTRKPVECAGPLSRRRFLEIGALGVGGLGLSDLLRLRAQAEATGKSDPDTALIFVWLPGGPPHLDTYDMKPDAPAEIRGEFGPIRTNVPGIEVCELLPRHAAVADRFSLIRSIAHTYADHGGGHKRFLTGREPFKPVDTVNDFPAAGSVVAKVREHRRAGVPNYVSILDGGREGVDVFAFGAAYLGPAHTPFAVPGDPSAANFKINNLALAPELASRLDDRVELLAGFDRLRQSLDRSGTMAAMDEFNQRAINLLTSDKARQAFDLSQEDPRLRDRYGRHAYGQRALLARRLVEAGSSFVTVVMENPGPNEDWPQGVLYNWDSHAVNGHIFNDARFRFPRYDQAIATLIEDLYARGLDKKVMLVVTGEFGRTPRIEYSVGTSTGVMQPGRDHWPNAMSVLVSGGGMRCGQVVGSTNAKGEHPQDRPLTPEDLWATVYRHLGIDSETTFPDYNGRPLPILPRGEPIRELFSA